MPSSVVYPLEGGKHEEARFYLYDNVGRTVWGEARIRREKNPDVLVLEVRQRGTSDWKKMLQTTAHDGKLLAATFGIRGGSNENRPTETTGRVPNEGS